MNGNYLLQHLIAKRIEENSKYLWPAAISRAEFQSPSFVRFLSFISQRERVRENIFLSADV